MKGSSRVEKGEDDVVRPDESVSQVSRASQRTVKAAGKEEGGRRSVPQSRVGSKASGVRERSIISMVLGK